MNRYFSGINSISFNRGFDLETKTFDKSKVPEMEFPGHVFYIKNPILLETDRLLTFFRFKTPSRRARELTKKHGGVPIVFETHPDESTLIDASRPLQRWEHVQRNPCARVERLYACTSNVRVGRIELAHVLEKLTFDEYREQYM